MSNRLIFFCGDAVNASRFSSEPRIQNRLPRDVFGVRLMARAVASNARRVAPTGALRYLLRDCVTLVPCYLDL
jgi:hypothetical protein